MNKRNLAFGLGILASSTISAATVTMFDIQKEGAQQLHERAEKAAMKEGNTNALLSVMFDTMKAKYQVFYTIKDQENIVSEVDAAMETCRTASLECSSENEKLLNDLLTKAEHAEILDNMLAAKLVKTHFFSNIEAHKNGQLANQTLRSAINCQNIHISCLEKITENLNQVLQKGEKKTITQ